MITNEAGRRTLADPRRNLSRYHGNPIAFESDNVVVCEEGDVVELFDGVSAKVFETPGHHPSCLTFEVGMICLQEMPIFRAWLW